jgi:outer membrane lipoprotein-sorting protein
MQKKRLLRWSVVLLITMVCSIPLFAGEFSADMVVQAGGQKGETTTSKIYVKGTKYRMEQEEDGQDIIIIVDMDAMVTRVLMPSEKMYMEIASDDIQSLANDPFQSAKKTESLGETQLLGTETISGYKCDKYLITREGTDVMTQWISKKLEFAVKVVQHEGEQMTMVLKNISEDKLDDSLFEIPDGYTPMGPLPMEELPRE